MKRLTKVTQKNKTSYTKKFLDKFFRKKKNTVFEYTKVLISSFSYMFLVHLIVMLLSQIFLIGDFTRTGEIFVSSLPFYGGLFAGYLGKATFENYDKNKNKIEAMKTASPGENPVTGSNG